MGPDLMHPMMVQIKTIHGQGRDAKCNTFETMSTIHIFKCAKQNLPMKVETRNMYNFKSKTKLCARALDCTNYISWASVNSAN
jgi:hypothetical protein